MQTIIQKAQKIRLLILDVDGVLTDGRIYIDDDGTEFKAFHTQDGVGIKMLLETGIEIAVISGRQSSAVDHRMRSLGVKYVVQGQSDKLLSYQELKTTLLLKDEEVAYIGDDLPDLLVMQMVGFNIAVADAHESIKKNAHYVTKLPGGKGAVREICDLIIKAYNE